MFNSYSSFTCAHRRSHQGSRKGPLSHGSGAHGSRKGEAQICDAMAGAEGSPVMSPAGIPSGAAGQQIDGAELARRMMLATEAASTAATVAAQALAGLKSRRHDEKSWYKTLPKPGVFDLKSREEELSMWRDFAWSLEPCLASFDIEHLADFETLRKNPSTEVDRSLMGDKEKSRSSFCIVFSRLKWVGGLQTTSLSILNAILGWSSFNTQKNS